MVTQYNPDMLHREADMYIENALFSQEQWRGKDIPDRNNCKDRVLEELTRISHILLCDNNWLGVKAATRVEP